MGLARLVLAALIAWLGVAPAANAVGVPDAIVAAYAYDATAHSALATEDAAERGPPAAFDRTSYDTDGRQPLGASARPDRPSTPEAAVLTTQAEFAQDGGLTTTTGRQAVLADEAISSPPGGQVAAKTADDAGHLVYRVHGGDAGKWGHSWTTENPLEMANPRSRLGLPKVNSGENVTCARVCDMGGLRKRDALPLDGNPGGGPEWLFPNPQQQLQELWTFRMEPPL